MAKEIKNENVEAVVEAVSKTEKFFNENGKVLGGIVAGLAVVAASNICSTISNVFIVALIAFGDAIAIIVGGLLAANELLNIKGIKASFVLTEYYGKIYVSARAIDEVNVQIIMERLGGGGHLNVAGAQLTDCSIEAAKRLIKETLDEMLREGDIE